MEFDHMGVDTAYHCRICNHHHCRRCGTCHRCGCETYLANEKERRKARRVKK